MKKFIQIKYFMKQNKIIKFCLSHLKIAIKSILTEIEISALCSYLIHLKVLREHFTT